MKRVVLVGAGHAHAVVLRSLARQPLHGARFTLVTPHARQIYSGMLPGVVAGHYRREEAEIDFSTLAEKAFCEVIRQTVVRLDARKVILDDGTELAYDIASIDVGSCIDRSIPGAEEHAVPARPFESMLAALDGRQRVGIVGAGHGGAELSMALAYRGCAVTLYAAKPIPETAIVEALRRNRVDYRPAMQAEEIEAGPVVRHKESRQEFDLVLLATGAHAIPWPGLAVDEAGFIRVSRTLQSISHPEVFASGDCAAVEGAREPKSGVYAVRHGFALARNLVAAVKGEPLVPYRSNPRALAIVTCGERRAIALRAGRAVQGRAVWHLKNWIDRRWVRSFRV